eukprot:gnl/Hemi2/8397_TR2901_c0_g1_i1.p1 gnl/Hemi2/8397_TR2901_c0_g1~~gnl/Hemi2/8397_TR2901_c0_g1_i1.p1  ORF type:complete len:517 (+),score=107.87 gnl/Hemi2/8397_TR2901_c0_g1_i1:45-1595(+)
MQRNLALLLLFAVSWSLLAAAATTTAYPLYSLHGPPDDAKCDPLCTDGLVCIEGQCGHCQFDSDCQNPLRICSYLVPTDRHPQCLHKPLFPNFTSQDFWGTLLCFLASIVAAGGGIGGGGLFVPVLMMISGFEARSAIPLSKTMIFGAALAQYFLQYKKRSPVDGERFLIDYSSASILEPLTLAGTIPGIMLNVIFPEWLIVTCLVVTLTLTCHHTYNKGVSIYNQETAADPLTVHAVDDLEASPLTPVSPPVVILSSLSAATQTKPALQQEIEQAFRAPSSASGDFLLEHPILVLSAVWAGMIFLSLLRGGHHAPSIAGVACGSGSFWFLTVLTVSFLGGVTWLLGQRLRARHDGDVLAGKPAKGGDVVWTSDSTMKYPAICLLAGIMAGLLGIGGGMLKGPLLLEMSLPPAAAAATSSFMILFTASATTAQFLILGMLHFDYAIWYFFVGFSSSLLGVSLMHYLVQRYRKNAFIVFSMAMVMGLSALLMGYSGVRDILIKWDDGSVSWGFSSLC